MFLDKLAGGWYAITNTVRQVGFAMTWPADIFGALWFWQVYGGAYSTAVKRALPSWCAKRSANKRGVPG